MRIVADTNVIISGALWDGAPCDTLLLAMHGDIELFTSQIILAEARKILSDPKERFHFSRQEIDDVINCVLTFAQIIEPTEIVRICRDPKDDHVIACALASKADYVITYDNDLLVLTEYNRIKIVKPEEFLVVMSK